MRRAPRGCCSPTETLGCYQPSVEVAAESFAGLDLSSGDDHQDDEEPEQLTSVDQQTGSRDAVRWTIVLASHSVMPGHRAVKTFCTPSRPALRAAAFGGRPRAGTDRGRCCQPVSSQRLTSASRRDPL
jgi:hypothetical protein